MRLLKPGLLGVGLLAGGCHEPTATATRQPAAPPVAATPARVADKPTRAGALDSLDMCYAPLPQRNPAAFLRAQHLPFKRSLDTISNDERGLFLGPKFVLGRSYVQWDNQRPVVRRLFIDNPRIRLSHGLHVGASQWAVLQQFGWHGSRTAMPDTFTIDCGFLDNGGDLVFRKGRLASVSLVNEAD